MLTEMTFIEATSYIAALRGCGPFQTVVYHEDGVYMAASCSCGWLFGSHAKAPHFSNSQVAHMCARHQEQHVNYNAILAGYAARALSYDEARDRLVEFGMSEDRADEQLDNALPHKIVTHSCASMRSSDGSGSPQIPCRAYRTQDSAFHNTCGEPCRWAMGKSGEGNPPWTDAGVPPPEGIEVTEI